MGNVLESKLNPFVDSIKTSIENGNYYGALSLSLILPDICSKLEFQNIESTKKRYVKFYEKFCMKYYQHDIGPGGEMVTFLNGDDFYSLRCSFLHQGETNIVNQKARRVLENFVFVETKSPKFFHCNKINGQLILQVDTFCLDIIKSVESWIIENLENESINNRATNLITIESPSQGFNI